MARARDQFSARRATKTEIIRMIEHINRNYGARVGLLNIDHAYGGYRITDERGAREYSPRGTAAETLNWLDGFQTALYLSQR